jgi:2-C-methyl-D-erythritol 4-phosphate cytidylyltransferase
MDAIRRLVSIIRDLQKQNHAIVLMLDANQTLKECSNDHQLSVTPLNGYVCKGD